MVMNRTNNLCYEKVYQEFEEKGYEVIGEKSLGFSQPHAPLDAVVIKQKEVVPTEIKSENEVRDFWTMADFDYKELVKTNPERAYLRYFEEVKKMVDSGKVSKDVASHMYFLEKTVSKVLDFRDGKWWIKDNQDRSVMITKVGYCVPSFEAQRVEKALALRGTVYEKINLSSTVLFKFIP